MEILDITVFVIYMILVLEIGIYYLKKTKIFYKDSCKEIRPYFVIF